MKKSVFILAFLLPALSAFTQATISGKVVDEKNNPLSFVAIVLHQNNKLTGSTASNETGQFQLPAGLSQGLHYVIRFSLVGYVSYEKEFVYPDTSFFSSVKLTADKNFLGNVTVTASKPLVTRRSDRYTINVENSFLANGNNGLEVLQRSPGIWVDNNGGIQIRGNQAVTVMINDIIQRMSGDELTEYLKTLRSEDISKIEVIPNPPAEYEASGSGGIIHIILKKARKDGLNGNASTQYRQQGREPFFSGSTSMDYKSGALYLFGGLGLSKDVNNSYGNNGNIFADQTSFSSVGTRHNENNRQQYRLGMSYELSKNQSFTIQSVASGVQMHHNFQNNIIQQKTGSTVTGLNTTDWIRKPDQVSTNAVYTIKTDTLGSSLKFIADYTNNSRAEINTFSGIYDDPTQDETHINTIASQTRLLTLQADHLQVLPYNWQFRAGVKYAGITRDNHVALEDLVNGVTVINTGGSNHFIYNENLLMGYSAAEKMMGKTSVKFGLRFEQTWSKGNSVTSSQSFARKYAGLFPSLSVTQTLNEQKGSAIYASYSRRLQRPGFNELNPYRLQLSTVITNVGNPDLQPQYTHNAELGVLFARGWSVALYFSSTTDIISQLSLPVGNVFENKFVNLDKNTSYGLNFEAPITVVKGWQMNNSFSMYVSDYTIGAFNNRRFTYSARHIETVSLKNIVDMEMIAAYRSPYVNGNSRVSDFSFVDMGFSRRILKGKGRLALYISDIFNISREQEKTDYLNTHFEFYQKRQTRNIGLNFSYNFSAGKKFSNKKTEQENSDEKRRI
jgi:iron complex outermembrane receptor protein